MFLNKLLDCAAFGFPKPTINWYVKRFNSKNFTGIIVFLW